MTEKITELIDKDVTFGDLLLFAFGVSPLLSKWICSYLLNRTQQIKINKHFSAGTDIQFGVS